MGVAQGNDVVLLLIWFWRYCGVRSPPDLNVSERDIPRVRFRVERDNRGGSIKVPPKSPDLELPIELTSNSGDALVLHPLLGNSPHWEPELY